MYVVCFGWTERLQPDDCERQLIGVIICSDNLFVEDDDERPPPMVMKEVDVTELAGRALDTIGAVCFHCFGHSVSSISSKPMD